MTGKPDTIVRLYCIEDGQLVDTKNEFPIEQLGGSVPIVGDLIVEPGVSGDQERRFVAAYRTVYEVKARYFLPHAHGEDYCYVAVVVEDRFGRDDEREIVCVS